MSDKENNKERLPAQPKLYKFHTEIPDLFGDPGINSIPDLERGVTHQLAVGEQIMQEMLKKAREMVSN